MSRVLAYASMTEKPDLELKEPKSPSVPFIPEVCMMIGTMDNETQKTRTLQEVISAYVTNVDCCATFYVHQKYEYLL